MEAIEIILLILGLLTFVVSFFLPGGSKDAATVDGKLLKGEIQKVLTKEIEDIKTHVEGVTEEAIEYSMEKTERALERISNEKIMAVSEYSDTVLGEINRNHKEVMFLYDLLSDKQKSIKLTMAQLLRSVKEAEAEAENKGTTIPPNSTNTKEKTEEYPIKSTQTKQSRIQTNEPNQNEQNENEPRNQNEKIVMLYRQGKSYVEIAKQLGLGVGEVKLVIDLTKNVIASMKENQARTS
ncbi:MAG: hypothetical protein LBM69_06825 [Lachnospiraceae bacterium]|jgi:hypothetical protein|nr:hypothetical protein [Lachnospiraceae bacterium]